MYKIIGSDQKIYGPVSAVQLRQWIAEGRVGMATLVQLEGDGDWKPLAAFAEFAVPPLTLPPRANRDEGSGMATAGLTFGILSNICCCFGLVFGALGVIFSCIALAQSNTHPQHRGRGMATAGLVLSIIGLLWHTIVPGLFGLWHGMGMFHHHPWRSF